MQEEGRFFVVFCLSDEAMVFTSNFNLLLRLDLPFIFSGKSIVEKDAKCFQIILSKCEDASKSFVIEAIAELAKIGKYDDCSFLDF